MINKAKCEAWCELMISIIKLSKELTDKEYDYIKANVSIAFGKLKLQELEAKDEQIQQYKSNSR